MLQWQPEALDLFWRWISQRQMAFHNRHVLKKPPPWCEDEVVQQFHFTNVYRELDPGTVWIVRQVLMNDRLYASERSFITLAYRLFGTEDVFEWLGVHVAHKYKKHPMRVEYFNEQWLADQLQELMDSGIQAFTGAYMVSNYGRSEPKSVVIADILGRAARGWLGTWAQVSTAATRQGAFQALSKVHGIGKFLAFQTLVDLCYPLPGRRGGGLLPHSNDDWVIAGPGAVRGLKLLLGQDFSPAGGADNEAIAGLVAMQLQPLQQLGMPWLRNERGEPILVDRSNMQNCLCEYSKYRKLLAEVESGNKSGGRKREFDPTRAHHRDARRRTVADLPGGVRNAAQTTMFE